MNLGTENKFETWVAIILGIIAVLSLGYWLTSSTSPKPSATTPVPAPTTTANRPLINPLDPTLRLDLLESSQNVTYGGKGRNIFVANSPIEIPKTIDPRTPKPEPKPGPPPPPPGPPPINLKFFGLANRAGEAQRIFLSEGESVFVAREGDIVNSRYRVVKINPQSVEIEDLLNNNRQSIPLTQG